MDRRSITVCGLVAFLVVAASQTALAQVHFTFTANTGSNATVALPTSANPNISGNPLVSGDEVGVFTPSGLCVGAVVWQGVNTAITVWGESTTPPLPGMRAGDQMMYRVWRKATNTEYAVVSVTYGVGDGLFSVNGIYVLSSLVATAPPVAPVLASPTDGTTGVSTSPTLSWNASSGATSYHLQVSTDQAFGTTVIDQGAVVGTSYNASGLLNNTVYYWRVSASNAGGTSAYSTVSSFTTVVAAPVLSSPANGALGVSTSPTLSWNASTGATSYHVQVSADQAFGTTLIDQTGITTTSYSASGLLNNTLYYWRVSASNAGGTSAYSTVSSFTTLVAAPVPVSPANGATGVSTTPTLTWNASAGATSYHVQVSTDQAFGTTLIDQSGITATSYNASGLSNNTLYYWKVSASNAGGTSAYSTVSSFTTVVGAPVLVSPANGATGVSPTPTLSWNASTGATSYHIQVSTDQAFGTTLIDQSGITATSFNASGLVNNTLYYWHVNASNAGGTGPFSGASNFTTVVGVPVLVVPANGTTGVSTSPTLSWNASAGATSYHIQVSTDPAFGTTVIDQSAVAGTSYNATGLLTNTVYYWHVNASNAGGTGQYSTASTFTTVVAAPVPVSPANNAIGTALSLALSWNASPGATSYRVQVSTDVAFGTTVIDQSSIATTSYTAGGLSNGTLYYWRVNAANSGGSGDWSIVWNFTTQALHLVVLPQGWNMMSSNVQPFDLTLGGICSHINPNMLLMKNGRGGVYWPAFGINTIGTWSAQDGYQIYMQSGDTLAVTGNQIQPQTLPISLVQNWNLVGYLRKSPMRIDSALVSISTDASMIAKNNSGQVYWPAFGINTIGSMIAGQGYQLYVSQAATLTYPSNPPTARPVGGEGGVTSDLINRPATPQHYPHEFRNTGVNAIVLVESEGLIDGDELAVWTSQHVIVGSGVCRSGKVLLTVWGVNALVKQDVPGAAEGEELALTLWSTADQREGPFIIESLTDALTGKAIEDRRLRYSTNAVTIARAAEKVATPATFDLSQNYPNPFNPATVIRFQVPLTVKVTLKVFDILGREVRTLIDELRQAGTYAVEFSGKDLASGMYIYRLEAGRYVQQKKLLLLK